MARVSEHRRLPVVRSVQGQALIETTLILPLVLLTVLLMLQLLWLLFVQYNLWLAASYTLRTGALQHGSESAMKQTLAVAMTATRPVLLEDTSEVDAREFRLLAARLSAEQMLHTAIAARITVKAPTTEQFERFSETRFDLVLNQEVKEIAIDHPQVRMAATDNPQEWLAARQLKLELWWCQPLEVPLAATILAELRTLVNNPVQLFCAAREAVVGKPLWGLRHEIEGPMLSGYRRY